PGAAAPSPAGPAPADDTERARRHELARLAWPEAAGTTPEQREALELAVRHQLTPQEVAAVLGLDPAAARELLASAACEVERTRAALAVVETGACPIVARLTGDNQVLLGTALRRELVRHVDDCPRCRRTAERAGSGAWPGTAVTPAELPLVEAPRAALHHAMAHAPRAHRRARGGPRFDRRGFPMDPKDHAARRERFRARAVTTTVVATVVAAPVLALWAAYRGAPLTGEGTDGRSSSATEADDGPGGDGPRARDSYENAGNARATPDPRSAEGREGPGVSVEVLSPGGSLTAPGGGRLAVQARSGAGATLITLTASGASPVRWSASTGAPWLILSQASGTLAPGRSFTIRVYVDDAREPAGHWSARVTIGPTGAVISLAGYGGSRPTGRPDPRPTATRPGPTLPDPTPTPSGDGEPTPTAPHVDATSPRPTPTPTPTDPAPTPSPSGDPGQG
ncbi:BACON domain-containing protein, partial [Streptomyces longispororuber]|uniref:BACON domain-containing protein n=1 Tax=Streptomyces longispororuber TaxID=68230 RepID=UPI001E456F09